MGDTTALKKNSRLQPLKPSDGFIDIKPLPSYKTSSFEIGQGYIILILILILLFFFFKKFLKIKKLIIKTPFERAIKKLGDINNKYGKDEALRSDESSKISLILRDYLNGKFQFNAKKLTTSEVLKTLSNRLSKIENGDSKKLYTQEEIETLVSSAKTVFNKLDLVSFSNSTQSILIKDTIKDVKELINKIEKGQNDI